MASLPPAAGPAPFMATGAWLCETLGAPEALVRSEVPLAPLGPGQVLVSHRAVALNFPDVLMIEGRYQLQPPLPFIPCMEASGEVLAVGEGVVDMQPGQPVITRHRFGALAQTVLVARSQVVPVPQGMPLAAAAGFSVCANTAAVTLMARAQLQGGERVLVLGAAGGVGLASIQLARVMGADVLAVASTAAKGEAAVEAGATIALAADPGSLKAAVAEATEGAMVDVVVDPVGGDLSREAMRCLRWGGRYAVVGFAAGRIPRLDLNYPLIKGLDILGVRAGEWGRAHPDAAEALRRRLWRMAGRGGLTPRIDARIPFERAPDAFRRLKDRQAVGKVIVEMPEPAR